MLIREPENVTDNVTMIARKIQLPPLLARLLTRPKSIPPTQTHNPGSVALPASQARTRARWGHTWCNIANAAAICEAPGTCYTDADGRWFRRSMLDLARKEVVQAHVGSFSRPTWAVARQSWKVAPYALQTDSATSQHRHPLPREGCV